MINMSQGRFCCVPGCKNTSRNNPGLQFHRFPSKKYEVERKKKWIIAVRRKSENNVPWVPTENTRICSSHFVDGVMSNDCYNKSYIPSIFPWKPLDPAVKLRKKRLMMKIQKKKIKRQVHEMKSTDKDVEHDSNIFNNVEASNSKKIKFCDIAVQTDFCDENEDDSFPTYLFSSLDPSRNEASVQAYIPLRCNKKPKTSETLIIPNIVKTKSIAVGSDNDKLGFNGFADIKNDATMKQLAGVSLSFFNILLNLLKKDNKHKFFRTINYENRLLLFLMKMKLGLSFSAISCLFRISRTTAADIFFELLNCLYINTKTWIFWPSKEAIKETMPISFKNYPNCRAIIDCTEIYTDTPPIVEQRVLMFSSSESRYTIKILVAITPSGYISFISKGYGGSSTDGFIVNDSGFIKLIEPGDEVMADKDFPEIHTELLKRQSVLVTPPFATKPKFTREEVQEGYSKASVKIHVKRAIQRLKMYKILKHVTTDMLPHINKIIYMVCVIANNKEPLIKKQYI